MNDKDGVATIFSAKVPGYVNDLKANVITFDYTYKLAENTRIKLGYQNSKVKADGQDNVKTNLYFAEIYSRF